MASVSAIWVRAMEKEVAAAKSRRKKAK